MPLPILQVPQFPNVPMAPGVPPVLRSVQSDIQNGITTANGLIGTANNIINQINGVQKILTGDGPGVAGKLKTPQWGIFDDGGTLAISADSVYSVEPHKEWKVSDFPVEGGSFESYNKVETPFLGSVTLVKSGSDGDKLVFLSEVMAICASLDLYSIVTPTITYDNLNPTKWAYVRKPDIGAGMIAVEVMMEEVRQGATIAFSNSAQPNGAAPASTGPVQAQAAPAATVASATVSSVLPTLTATLTAPGLPQLASSAQSAYQAVTGALSGLTSQSPINSLIQSTLQTTLGSTYTSIVSAAITVEAAYQSIRQDTYKIVQTVQALTGR